MNASSTNVRALFAAARDDAPGEAARDEMWSRVAMATGIAATAAAAASATASAAPAAASGIAGGVSAASGAAKLLALGALIGALSAAVGVIAVIEVTAPQSATSSSGAVAPTRPVHAPAPGARLAEPTARPIDPAFAGRPAAPTAKPARIDPESDLAEEARLVTDARKALVAGDPVRALALVRGTHRLAMRALEPEELVIEARALRALGRADDAAATELRLKSRFPGHALAR